MCSTGPSTYRSLKEYIYSSCYYHHQIGSIHLSHCFHIFPWLCAWDVCYIIFCHLLYIHSGKTGNLFSLILCSLWWVQIVGYVLACWSYPFVCTLHHLIIIIVQTLSEDIELIKCLSDMICRVCKIKHILSVIHYTICGAVCFQFTHFLRDDWENIHTLSHYHNQTGSMNYYPLFRVRSWNNGMRCMSFYILFFWTFCPCLFFSHCNELLLRRFTITLSKGHALKPKGHHNDCPDRHWRRWRQASTSPVTTKVVTLTTFPFLWPCSYLFSFPGEWRGHDPWFRRVHSGTRVQLLQGYCSEINEVLDCEWEVY